MTKTNRTVSLNLAVVIGAVLVTTLVVPAQARAAGFLEGTFYVICPEHKVFDKVEAITRNHDSEKCNHKTVDDGTAYLVCPDGHWRDNKVENITRQHECQWKKPGGGICGKQCRGPFPKPDKVED